jgi:hypothetical protein
VRTVIAPLLAEVEAELAALDARLQDVARRYIRRLALEPFLGPVVPRGPLAALGARRVYFDRDSQPDDLFRSRRLPARRGDQDLSEGPRWRIVYWIGEAECAQTRIVVILAVGLGHADPPNPDAYQLAARRLRAVTSVASTRRRVK